MSEASEHKSVSRTDIHAMFFQIIGISEPVFIYAMHGNGPQYGNNILLILFGKIPKRESDIRIIAIKEPAVIDRFDLIGCKSDPEDKFLDIIIGIGFESDSVMAQGLCFTDKLLFERGLR